jgi:hypothetical protein
VWRDRCVTAALWIAWCYPIEALARIAAPDVAARIGASATDASLLGEAFVADVLAAARLAGVLVASLVSWGAYTRRRHWPRASGSPAASSPTRQLADR